MFHSATGKIFSGQMKLQLSCLEGTHHCVEEKKGTAPRPPNRIPTVKYGGGSIMVWDCLRAWTVCYHRRENEFQSLSRHFAGECKANSRAVHTRQPKNIVELKQFCKEEWSKIPPSRCTGLICNCRTCLVEVIAAKGGSTSY